MTRDLVLSLFPGADLLGRGFEAEGYCVVRGPDIVWGGDIREFHPTPGRFDGVIGGPPCQDFSSERRCEPSGEGEAMLREYSRVVAESGAAWFLAENVPSVPDIQVPGYTVQRLNLTAAECGGRQRRNRCFQFGSRDGSILVVERRKPEPGAVTEAAALAIEGSQQTRRAWPDFCELQGLPRTFNLPGLSLAAKYRAVGNGVPVYMARVLARAVRARVARLLVRVCICGCGRPVEGRHVMAEASCRKRMQRRREEQGPGHNLSLVELALRREL
ncbi:MAG TPA: DNA cytosine methyltransferase [Opitutaceae bacterium]|nr:DNA cytosine methyltransferase [Opitutaceae bacterium]